MDQCCSRQQLKRFQQAQLLSLQQRTPVAADALGGLTSQALKLALLMVTTHHMPGIALQVMQCLISDVIGAVKQAIE